jgi:hypothetical protein
MATNENTVLVIFNVQLRFKQKVPWTILPVDRVNTIVLFVCQNSRIELVCVVFKPLKIKTKYKNPSHVGLEIKTKYKNPSHVGLEIKTKYKNPTYLAFFF